MLRQICYRLQLTRKYYNLEKIWYNQHHQLCRLGTNHCKILNRSTRKNDSHLDTYVKICNLQEPVSFLSCSKSFYCSDAIKANIHANLLTVDKEIGKLDTVDDILQYWNQKEKDMTIATPIMRSLWKVVHEDSEAKMKLLNHPELRVFNIMFAERLTQLKPAEICVGTMLYLELDSERDIKNAEKLLSIIVWNRKSMELNILYWLQRILMDYQETELRKKTLTRVNNEIKERWDNPKKSNDILGILAASLTKGKLTTEVLSRLEDLSTKFEMNPRQCVKTLSYLRQLDIRKNSPLLKAATQPLLFCYFNNFDLASLLMVPSHLAHFRMNNTKLLSNISRNIMEILPLTKITPKLVDYLVNNMVSYRLLAHKDPDLIEDSINYWLEFNGHIEINQLENKTLNQFVKILTSCGHLCHLPENFEKYIDKNLDEIFDCVRRVFEHDWIPVIEIDIALYASMLGKSTSKIVNSVLSNDFLAGLNEQMLETQTGKILLVNSYAQCQLEGYTGATLSKKFMELHKFQPVQVSRIENTNRSQVYSAMKLIAPTPDAFISQGNSRLGHIIDFQILVNDKRELQEIGNRDMENDPEGLHRMAIQLVPYPHELKGTDGVIGRQVMIDKQLKKLGYKVALLHVVKFKSIKTDKERKAYLEEIISKAMKDKLMFYEHL